VMVAHDVPSAVPFAMETSNFYAKAGARAAISAPNSRAIMSDRIRVAGRDAQSGFFSLLPPSAGRFASLLPSLRVGSGVSVKLLIPKGYRV